MINEPSNKTMKCWSPKVFQVESDCEKVKIGTQSNKIIDNRFMVEILDLLNESRI